MIFFNIRPYIYDAGIVRGIGLVRILKISFDCFGQPPVGLGLGLGPTAGVSDRILPFLARESFEFVT